MAKPWRPRSPRSNASPARPLSAAEPTLGPAQPDPWVDRGYRGHQLEGEIEVFVAGRRRGITATIRRELRRRSAIEAMIGHMKLEGDLAHNHLKGWAMRSVRCCTAPATTCA
jgi:IS5 family transposase